MIETATNRSWRSPVPFESDVIVREVGDDTWELVGSLQYKGNTDRFEVPAGFRIRMVAVGRVKIADVIGRFAQWMIAHAPLEPAQVAGPIAELAVIVGSPAPHGSVRFQC